MLLAVDAHCDFLVRSVKFEHRLIHSIVCVGEQHSAELLDELEVLGLVQLLS